ncbi:MAG: OmpA family protein [Bacteroidia bacterium]
MTFLLRKSVFVIACITSGSVSSLENGLNKGIPDVVLIPQNANYKAVDMPSILFTFNSTQIYREKEEDQKMYDQKVNSNIERAKKIFNEETSTVIEICGHCDSREANKKKLSFARAKYIADELIKKGISKKRIVVKGEGDEEPLMSKATIDAAQTDEDKENMYLQNRRITIKILRWDYKEKTK